MLSPFSRRNKNGMRGVNEGSSGEPSDAHESPDRPETAPSNPSNIGVHSNAGATARHDSGTTSEAEQANRIAQLERQLEAMSIEVKETVSRQIAPVQADLEKALSERDDAASKYRKVVSDYTTLYNRYTTLRNESQEVQKLHQQLLQDVKDLKGRRDDIQALHTEESSQRIRLHKDNILLRAQIADMSNAQEPLHEERYYIEEFSEIGGNLESWAATETRQMSKDSLKPSDIEQLVSVFQQCGEEGMFAANWLKTADKSRFQDRRNRIALIRHASSIVIFEQIFTRFAFGLDRTQSKLFLDIEQALSVNGSSSTASINALGSYAFSQLLSIRQSVGREILPLCAGPVSTNRALVYTSLVTVLGVLVPNTPSSRIQDFSTRLIDKCISLRQAMTAEQAVYRFNFYNNDWYFDEEWMEAQFGDNRQGKIALCTFPGLRRYSMIDGGKRAFLSVVKSTVNLGSKKSR
jgi:hypothetical protein